MESMIASSFAVGVGVNRMVPAIPHGINFENNDDKPKKNDDINS